MTRKTADKKSVPNPLKVTARVRTSSGNQITADKKSVTDPSKKWLLESESHHQNTKNKGDYLVSEPHQIINIEKVYYWQKVVNKNQKVFTQNQNLIVETKKGDYSVSEPHRRD